MHSMDVSSTDFKVEMRLNQEFAISIGFIPNNGKDIDISGSFRES